MGKTPLALTPRLLIPRPWTRLLLIRPRLILRLWTRLLLIRVWMRLLVVLKVWVRFLRTRLVAWELAPLLGFAPGDLHVLCALRLRVLVLLRPALRPAR